MFRSGQNTDRVALRAEEAAASSGRKVQARALALDFSKTDGPQWHIFQTELENLDVGVLGMFSLKSACL